MAFSVNKKFRKIFEQDPLAANIFLLLCELSGTDGKLLSPADSAALHKEIRTVLFSRFEDLWGWQI
jgi:hypothetical protein